MQTPPCTEVVTGVPLGRKMSHFTKWKLLVFLFEVCFAKGDFLGLICLKEHLFAIRFIIISGM